MCTSTTLTITRDDGEDVEIEQVVDCKSTTCQSSLSWESDTD